MITMEESASALDRARELQTEAELIAPRYPYSVERIFDSLFRLVIPPQDAKDFVMAAHILACKFGRSFEDAMTYCKKFWRMSFISNRLRTPRSTLHKSRSPLTTPPFCNAREKDR